MANKSIPLKDKQLVVERLAEGQSTRQAIEGTAISSNQTAARIAKQESHVITQYRETYLRKIEANGGSQSTRAWVLGKMVQATKTIRVTLPNGTSSSKVYMVQVEDWDARFKAIQYIDQLAGVTNSKTGLRLNIMQQINNSPS